jgi:hypothetical protein
MVRSGVIRLVLFYLLFVASCGYALAKGGAPERVIAIAYAIAVPLTVLLLSPLKQRYAGFEYGVMVVDLALFVVMVAVAVFSERYWPLWMSAMQAVTLLAHLGRFLPQIAAWTYWNAVTLWSYPIMALLVIATRRHQIRLARSGADNSWVSFSARSTRSDPTR